MGALEANLLFWSFAVTFLLCYAVGVDAFISLLASTAVAWIWRDLWLKRIVGFNNNVAMGLGAAAVILLFVTDPFDIESIVIDFLYKHSSALQPIVIFGVIPLFAALYRAVLGIIGEKTIVKIQYSRFVGASFAFGSIFFVLVGLGVIDNAAVAALLQPWTFYALIPIGWLAFQIATVLLFSYIILKALLSAKKGVKQTRTSAEKINIDEAFAASARLMSDIEKQHREGHFTEARQSLEVSVRQLRDAPGHDLLKSQLWETVGKIDVALTDYSSAKWHFNAALEAYDAVTNNDPVRRLVLLENVGLLATRLGDWTTAADTLAQVEVQRREELGPNHPDLAITLVALGGVKEKQGELAAADHIFHQALTIQRNVLSKNHIEIAGTLKSLGFLALNAERPSDACRYFEETLRIERGALGAFHPDVGLTLVGFGRALDAVDNRAAGETSLHDALSIALLPQGVGLRDAAYQALSLREAKQDRLGAAIFFGKEAVNAIQLQRTNLATLTKDLQSSFLATKEDIYRNLASLLVEAGRLAEAQRVLDLLKDDELSQFNLRHAPMDWTRALELTLSELRWKKHGDEIVEDLALLNQDYQDLLSKSSRRPDEEARIETIRTAFDLSRLQLKTWLDDLVAETRTAGVEAQSEVRALNLDYLESLQSELADLSDNVVLLYFVAGTQRLSIILTTPTLQVSRDVEIGRAQLHKWIHDFLYEIRKQSSHTEKLILLARALHDCLIAPIADYLIGEKVIMSVLDGALRYLPLSALHDGTNYLIARHAFATMTPAAHKPMTPDKDWTKKGVGALGITRTKGMDDIDAVDDELRGIVRQDGENVGIYPGRRYLDAAFTANALAETLATRNVVHIASHFTLDSATAASSRLMLGNGMELSLQDLDAGRYKFTAIDLVTLSACETALGSDRVIGDPLERLELNGREFESLGAMIQRRGARAVIATLWAVEDRSTALLMKHFYQGRRNSLTKAEALRQAQLYLLDEANTGQTSEAHANVTQAHPYFWAPFVLIGNWL